MRCQTSTGSVGPLRVAPIERAVRVVILVVPHLVDGSVLRPVYANKVCVLVFVIPTSRLSLYLVMAWGSCTCSSQPRNPR